MTQPKQATQKPEVEIIDDPFDLHIDGLDESAQEHREPVYAAIQWHNGSVRSAPGIAKEGGFFINGREQKKAASLPNWSEETIIFDSGDEETGPGALSARIAIIRSRKCWTRKDRDGRMEFFPWNQYQEGMASKQQYLVAVEGCSEIFCLSVKGTTGIAIEDALSLHNKKVVSEVRKLTKQNTPQYALWMELKGGEYKTVGKGNESSKTTPPRLILPETIDQGFLKKAFVGKENVIAFQEVFKEAETWANRWKDAKSLRESADGDGGAQWTCLRHLAEQYLEKIEQLRKLGENIPHIEDSLLEEIGGTSPEQWDDGQMQDALGTLAFLHKRAVNKATTKAMAPTPTERELTVDDVVF